MCGHELPDAEIFGVRGILGRAFRSFEDAWGYIRERFPEQDWEDYCMAPATGMRETRYLDPCDPRAGMVVES